MIHNWFIGGNQSMRASMFVLDQTVRYVAIIKRYKDGRNYYVVPGGKVEAHENIQQAAIREIAEELGLAIEQSDIFDAIIEKGNVFYFAKTNYSCLPLKIQGEEKERSHPHNSYEPMWLEWKQLSKLMVFPKYDYLQFEEIVSKIL